MRSDRFPGRIAGLESKGNQVRILDSTRCCESPLISFRTLSHWFVIIHRTTTSSPGRRETMGASQKTCLPLSL